MENNRYNPSTCQAQAGFSDHKMLLNYHSTVLLSATVPKVSAIPCPKIQMTAAVLPVLLATPIIITECNTLVRSSGDHHNNSAA